MRTPYFLYAAIAVPIVDVLALLVACVIEGLRHPTSAGGNVGNYDLSGLGVIIMVAGISTLAGLAFSMISLWRKERGRMVAVICVALYLLPILWATTHVLGFELSKWRYERFEAAQQRVASN